jgi:methionyl-tRNA synthetase
VHGFLTLQGEKMSKSRGNFLDPNDMVAALGQDGTRYSLLREIEFDRDSDVSWDSFVRRYNADLANDFGNLLNRTVTMAGRYLGGARPAPGGGSLAAAWPAVLETFQTAIDGWLLHDALAALWGFVGDANRFVDAEKPWTIAKAAKAGEDGAEQRLADVLGDLVEACRLVALAAAPFMPVSAPRVLAQLGYDCPYRDDGNGGPPVLDELRWGAHGEDAGTLGAAEPLFPRLESEAAAESGSDRPSRG